jgi:hypothetical protein
MAIGILLDESMISATKQCRFSLIVTMVVTQQNMQENVDNMSFIPRSFPEDLLTVLQKFHVMYGDLISDYLSRVFGLPILL